MGPCLGLEDRVGPRSFAKMPAQSMRELVLTSRCRDVFVRQSFLTFRAPRNGAPMSLGGGFPDFQTSQGRSLLAWSSKLVVRANSRVSMSNSVPELSFVHRFPTARI